MSKSNRRNSAQKRVLKGRLAERHGAKCKLCGCPLTLETATIDHKVRLRDGGSWHISNLQLACSWCNSKRS